MRAQREHSKDPMPSLQVRLDMSEFMERHTVSKLIGSPPGEADSAV
jgi:hypothetical protein